MRLPPRRRPLTQILYATDLHGNQRAYDRLWSRARDLGVDAVVLGGDLLPLPLGKNREPVRLQREFVEDYLGDSLRRQRDAGRAVYGLLGNDDWAACRELFTTLAAEGAYYDLHLARHSLDDALWIAGYSCVPVTPFRMSDWDRYDSSGWTPKVPPRSLLLTDTGVLREAELSELRGRPTLEEDLRDLARAGDPSCTVYVCHTPPHGTALDVMHGGAHIGSHALRAFIETHQPPLTLHGHVHESHRISGAFVDRLGATVCVNPGDSRTRLRAVLVDPADPGSAKVMPR
jgi:Icc-related predicted phosphoesterase